MSTPFNPHRGLIVVEAVVDGPGGNSRLSVALDTGATDTILCSSFLAMLGYNLAGAARQIPVTMGSGVVLLPRVAVSRLTALGQGRLNFPVLAHTFPPTATIQGILGLDFLRGQAVNIDFRTGLIDLQ
jgi:hypothetical protein